MVLIPLSQLLPGKSAVIQAIEPTKVGDVIAKRLYDLGFIPGERVCVAAVTPFQSGPLVIKLGMTRFALRQNEAARILVHKKECIEH